MPTNNAFNSLNPVEVAKGGTGSSTFTTNGTLYYNGTSIVSTATGNSGQILLSNGASAPTYQNPSMKLFSSQTASNSTSIDFTSIFTNTPYSLSTVLMVTIDGVTPATDGSSLILQISNNNGSSWVTTNYTSGINTSPYNSATLTNTNSTSDFVLSTGLDSALSMSTYHSVFYIYDVDVANIPYVSGQCSFYDNTAGVTALGNFGGSCTTTGVNALRFIMSSGNIAAGNFAVYALIP